MIGIESIVYFIVYLLAGALVLGLLWYLIGYIESQGLGPPVVFKIIRIVFVVLVILLAIGILLNLMGFPLIRFSGPGPGHGL